MRFSRIVTNVVLLIVVSVHPERCFPQSIPVATQQMQISAFSAATPISTGLGQGRNVALTAGADIAFAGLRAIPCIIEIRGMYPIAAGNVDKQKSFVAGPVVGYGMRR